MRQISRISRLLVLVLTGLALSAALACGEGEDEGANGLADGSLRPDGAADIIVPPEKPVVIGASLPLSGPDGVLGEEERAAVAVAVERWKAANGKQIKGHDIEVRVEDDGCTEADIAVQAAERLLRREGLVGVIGPSCSEGAAAAIPVYADAGIVAISGAVTETGLTTGQPAGRFFFRTAYRNDLVGVLIGIFASGTLAGEKAFVVDDSEAYGQDLAQNAQRAMEAAGVSVTRESVQRGAVDFTPLAQEISQAAPAFVGFAGFNPEAALLYRQLRDAGYTGLFGAGDAAASVGGFVEPVGPEAAEGVLFAGCPLALPDDFRAELRKVLGHEPEASTFLGQVADATTVLLNAVARVAEEQPDGSLAIDPAALRDAVRSSMLEQGISGPIAFDENGDRVPEHGDTLSDVIDAAVETGDSPVFLDLGLVPCQVQSGRLVNVLGPGASPTNPPQPQ